MSTMVLIEIVSCRRFLVAATHCYGGARARIMTFMIFSLLELRDVSAVGEAGIHVVLGVHFPQIENNRESTLLTVGKLERCFAQRDRSVAFDARAANLVEGDELVHDHGDEDLLVVDFDLGNLLGLHFVDAVSFDNVLDHGLGLGEFARAIHYQLDLEGFFVRVVAVGVEPTPVQILRGTLHQAFDGFKLLIA